LINYAIIYTYTLVELCRLVKLEDSAKSTNFQNWSTSRFCKYIHTP